MLSVIGHDEKMTDAQNTVQGSGVNLACPCTNSNHNGAEKLNGVCRTPPNGLNHYISVNGDDVLVDTKPDTSSTTKFQHKILITCMASCLVGLICLLLTIFVSPQLFFKNQGNTCITLHMRHLINCKCNNYVYGLILITVKNGL